MTMNIRKIGIIGFGRFGRYLASKIGLEYAAYDVVQNVGTLANAASQAVVVMALPMRHLREGLYGCPGTSAARRVGD